MAKWFGAQNNHEVRFSKAVKCKKRPHAGPNFAAYSKVKSVIIDELHVTTVLTFASNGFFDAGLNSVENDILIHHEFREKTSRFFY